GIYCKLGTGFFFDIDTGLNRNRGIDLLVMVTLDVQMLVPLNKLKLLVGNDQVPIVPDKFQRIILNTGVLILLGMNKYLLEALSVLKPKFVESAAARGRMCFDRRFRFLIWKRVRRHCQRIVDRTGNNGAVGIALKEMYNDLHPDPRNEHAAPMIPGP